MQETLAMDAARPVLAIIGPSASGKSSVVRALHRRRLIRVHPTWTTRPPRRNEIGGSLEHRFVSEAAFDDLRRRGFFLQTAELPGLPYRYGLPPVHASAEGTIDAVMLRARIVPRLASAVPRLVVYQIADEIDRARRRLVRRGCTLQELDARQDDHRREIDDGSQIADRVFLNDGSLADLVETVVAALRIDMPRVAS